MRNMGLAGVARSVAMKITGHKTESVYLRYMIASERDIRAAGEKLARYIADAGAEPLQQPLQTGEKQDGEIGAMH